MSALEEREQVDIGIAKRVAQISVLEEQKYAALQEAAKLARHVGMLRGLVKGALRDDALSTEYRTLAARVLAQLDGERSVRAEFVAVGVAAD